MPVKKSCRYMVCDFETTVYAGQTRTDVWASAITEMFSDTEDVIIYGNIADTFDYLFSLKTDLICYYHNLKFDGTFWIDFLMNQLNQEPALELSADGKPIGWLSNKAMPNNSFKCTISSMGQWYIVTMKKYNHIIEFRDSMKLLPFSVKRIGESFKTKHKKLEMEYTGFRYPNCPISTKERKYIANDVLVIREALEFMYNEGHDKLTIGACCLSEFSHSFHNIQYKEYFPNLYKEPLDESTYGFPNVGEYIRASYAGGWCYLVKGKENKIYTNGSTADVNSLYPSMMSSESRNFYPVGKPEFTDCTNYTEEQVKTTLERIANSTGSFRYYFVRIRTRFHIKPGKLPFIHIRNTFRFKSNECVETTDYFNKVTGEYQKYYFFGKTDGEKALHDTAVTMVLTMTDLKLFLEHYDVENFELLDYCEFATKIGLFDEYMEKYKRIKQVSKGATRELAKLFLNNLYGKMASSTDSSFKIPTKREDGSIGLYDINAKDKKPGYIPIGSAITSYARNFTIRAAQANYHGANERGFIYADTDSIHCDLNPDEIVGIKVHESDFCCWKLESEWDEAIYARQKTYIEHVVVKDGEKCDPEYDIKCAGMPETSKKLFRMSLEKTKLDDNERKKYSPEALQVIDKQYTLKDFKRGLKIPGKLLPKRIPGGTLLVETTYEMR